MSLTAIVVAAGSSQRMGFDKLLAPIAGKRVLERSIEAFSLCEDVKEIIVVCPKERLEKIDIEFSNKVIHWTDGGADRHDSVAAGIELIPDAGTVKESYIAVHDGARPLITPSQISRVYRCALEHQCACSAVPVTDTVKRADAHGIVQESVCRDNLWVMQTPQIFRSDLLVKAYRTVKAKGERVTDEVSALQLVGHSTHLVNNPDPNIKITFPHDIELAEKLLAAKD